MSQFFDRLNEGGPFFMYPLLLILIIIFVLIVNGFLNKANIDKTLSLLSSLSLFAIVWGFLGHMIGMITALDTIEAVGDISSAVLAGGLKVSLLTLVFGSFIFLVGRLGMIILTMTQK
ncbi:MAG: MotA/TolQ/ExbB proton channel family protein [Bacteroidia bacterium]|nr:MotA/TolQ/ExbB proton channel family protein [Bacteroidia bacterium]